MATKTQRERKHRQRVHHMKASRERLRPVRRVEQLLLESPLQAATDYEAYTVTELRALIRGRGLKVPYLRIMKKAPMIDILKEDDES